MDIRVQEAVFDAGAELNRFSANPDGTGAIVSFSGVVRNNAEGTLDRMEIEHYAGMTERAIAKIAEEAAERWALTDVLVIHRFGALVPGDVIMMVATASAHRVAAFEAAEFLMDYLKSRAPFWKKEYTNDGAEWVVAKDHDEESLSRWDGGNS